MKILISDAFDSSLPEKLAPFGSVTQDKGELARAEVVLIRSKTRCDREYLDAAPNLRLIIRGGVGLDNVDREYAAEKGILVFNTAAASSVAVAELAFTHLLALPNHVVRAHDSMKAGQWLKKELKRTELFGKTLVILGCGRIGTEVAKRARAFGMEVLGYDILPLESEYMTIYQDLETVIPRGDYFSLHLPATPRTRGLVNRDLLARMKHGVYMSNTGRAATVVEEDVAEALRSGQLAGYATDVWNSDPPAASPLLEAPNTLLSPHLGASTRENLLRIGEIVVQLLEKYRQGELRQN